MSSEPLHRPRAIAELAPSLERIAGHAVAIELLNWPVGGPQGCCCGGYLTVGTTRLWLNAEHASNLADRVRSAIDEAVISASPHSHSIRRLS